MTQEVSGTRPRGLVNMRMPHVTSSEPFEQFYLAEATAVFQTVYLLCRDRGIAEDATREAFARAFERWERLRNQPWAEGWVTRTAINVAKRRLRRHPAPFPPSGHDPDLDEGDRSVARGRPASRSSTTGPDPPSPRRQTCLRNRADHGVCGGNRASTSRESVRRPPQGFRRSE
jgi:DNA-directed RNA polymerase specialized sigma24 family protein